MARRNKYIFAKKRKSQKIKERIVIVLIMIGILVVLAFLYVNLFGTASKVTLRDDLTAELGSEAYVSEYIEEISGGTLIEDKKIDTSKVGEVNCDVGLDIDGNARVYDFNVTVVDTTEPAIEGSDSFTVLRGVDFDLKSQFVASDNSDGQLDLGIKGEYDLNVAGEYPLTVEAADSSGNVGSKAIVLKVIDISKQEGDITFLTGNGFTATREAGLTTIDGNVIVNKTFSVPETYGPGGILNDVWNAWGEMSNAAYNDGVYIYILSGYRSYYTQNNLYESYVLQSGRDEADTYSARPGHSEHQIGLAIDINSVAADFEETAEGKWLAENSYKYGYILRYPENKQDATGYIYKPYHFRYVGKDLAETLYNGGDWITLEEYYGLTSSYPN